MTYTTNICISHIGRVHFGTRCLVALVVKDSPANAGDVSDKGSIPGLGRSPGGGHGNPLQYSSVENPRDRGAWQGYSPLGDEESDTTKVSEHILESSKRSTNTSSSPCCY